MLIENFPKIFYLLHTMKNAIIAKNSSFNTCNTVKKLET